MTVKKGLFFVLLLVTCLILQTESAKSKKNKDQDKDKDSDLIVKTTEGNYQGRDFNGVRAFLGIRFAEPPVNNLRWRPPVEKSKFDGTADATVSGNCCPQSGIFKNLTVVQTEDCLTLDVYAPYLKKDSKSSKLPVKFYIHGGGFSANSASLYYGDELVKDQNAVVVFINYRLSYQGFMVFSELLDENDNVVNFGILDQQLALKWVQNNAAVFGGDKDNVVIFGNSAGGLSVLIHYTLESSKNLFKVGVSESAGPWNLISAKDAAKINDPLAQRFGCYVNNLISNVNLTCMRAVPWQNIYNYTWAAAQPVFDNLIKRPISNSYAQTSSIYNKNPIIIGNSHYEGNQFAWLALRIITMNPHPPLVANFQQYANTIKASFALSNTTLTNVINYYQKFVVDGNYFIPLREALGDYGIKCGVALSAYNALKSSKKVFNYFFTRDTANWRYTELNATHTAEVPYVLLSNGTFFEAQFTSAEKTLAQQLVQYITNFQNTLDPNKQKGGKKVKLTPWPTLASSKSSTLQVDLDSSTITLPIPEACSLYWNDLIQNQTSSRRNFEKFTNDPEAMRLNLFHG